MKGLKEPTYVEPLSMNLEARKCALKGPLKETLKGTPKGTFQGGLNGILGVLILVHGTKETPSKGYPTT